MTDKTASPHAGRSQEDRLAQEKSAPLPSQESAGGPMAVQGTQADADHSHAELSEEGKKAWRTGSGIDGGGKSA